MLERGARRVLGLLYSQITCEGVAPNHQAPRSLFLALHRRNATGTGYLAEIGLDQHDQRGRLGYGDLKIGLVCRDFF